MLEAADVLPKTVRNNPKAAVPGKKAKARAHEKAKKAEDAAAAAAAPVEAAAEASE